MSQEEGRYTKQVGSLPNHLACFNRRDPFRSLFQKHLDSAEIDNYDIVAQTEIVTDGISMP